MDVADGKRRAVALAASAEGVRLAGQAALGEAAGTLAEAVRAGLDGTPGGDHARPWERTGALRDSIGSVASGNAAAVGSASPVAVFQELGTARVPPRPFLAPAAARAGEAAARAVGAAVAARLREVLG